MTKRVLGIELIPDKLPLLATKLRSVPNPEIIIKWLIARSTMWRTT